MNNQPKILLTGSTGNVGKPLAKLLREAKIDFARGVRSIKGLGERRLDFADRTSFAYALDGIETVFLIRPPALADVSKYFIPFLEVAKEKGVSKIVFLSLQGAESISFVPHAKIEKAVLANRY